MLRALLKNTVLSTLVLVLVLVMGIMSYNMLPRQQDPTINFNWIVVLTALPGASAEDVEARVTQPLEDSLRKLKDVKFISSTSRVGLSNILVRFRDVDARTFDKRVNDLRREIQNKQDELPTDVEDSTILEVTSDNAFPSATVVLKGQADDENLRSQAYLLKRELERMKGVDRVDSVGLDDPELQIRIDMNALAAHHITPNQLADIVQSQWQDVVAGKLKVGGEQWLVRHLGQSIEPEVLARLRVPVPQADGRKGEVLLGELAQIETARADATQEVLYDGKPGVMFAIMKSSQANMIDLVQRIEAYVDEYNTQNSIKGVEAVLADDQTLPTRSAIGIMENNALQGLFFVLLVSWLFLGWRVGMLVALAIPFSLAGVFVSLVLIGETLNLTVLLGVVIALGMLVDVAVVMVEAMLYRLHKGDNTIDAAINSMKEVGWPLFAAILTTIAAFLPLMLLPGIMGEFMRVVPLVVTIALVISLAQAFWMLPSQTHMFHLKMHGGHRLKGMRERILKRMQNLYGRLLVKSFRHPILTMLILVSTFASAISLVTSGRITTNLFAADTLRTFYINLEMPAGTTLQETTQTVREMELKAMTYLKPEEVRATVAYGGQMFTEMEPLLGDVYGQVFISLGDPEDSDRGVDQIVDDLREMFLKDPPAGAKVSLLKLTGGVPSSKPISVKVRGESYERIQEAIVDLTDILASMDGVHDISNDASMGSKQLVTRLNLPAINRVGLDPNTVVRTLRLMTDGEFVAQLTNNGELVDLRVRADSQQTGNIDAWLATPIATPNGGSIALGELVKVDVQTGYVSLKHYNFSRSITLEADLDKTVIDTVEANDILKQKWSEIAINHPGISLDFSGELDDIYEALDAMGMLFVLGVGLMYLILGAQFNSFLQPLIILFTIPMAFTGVAYGLFFSGNPLSLYTLYGVVALSGIAVNSAIVLMAAANERRGKGMSVLHSIVYAARRRLIPIVITATTTMAGLMGLALGIGGSSLIFGPVATAIVWGISFSTILTLFTIPLIYRLVVRK